MGKIISIERVEEGYLVKMGNAKVLHNNSWVIHSFIVREEKVLSDFVKGYFSE
jgi:hypothetical protein